MERIQHAWRCVLETRSELGEGAFWDDHAGVLYWIDILRGEIHRYDSASGADSAVDRAVSLGAPCGTVVPRASGGLVAALPTGLVHVDPDWGHEEAGHEAATDPPPRLTGTGEAERRTLPIRPNVETTPLLALEADRENTRANDGKCDPQGRLWQGTMGFDSEGAAGALYRIDCKRQVTREVSDIRISNGLCWDSQARRMYYIDTPTQRVDTFDFDPTTGSIENRRAAIQVDTELGSPDGMTIDENGHLWIAMWDGAAVTHWDPQSGELLAVYELPVSRVTSCAFGGTARRTLYVTTASAGLSSETLVEQPLAGSLFALDPGVSGPTMAQFCG